MILYVLRFNTHYLYWQLQVFAKDMDRDTLLLHAARAARIENQDAIDASIVGMLGDPKEVNSSII